MVDHRPSGWIGTILQDKWRIEAKIARGGVATVFRASHRRGQLAAIKIMHPEFARNPDARSRFLREGYVANKVGHPGVVNVLDDDVTDDGSAFIVMELLEDGHLLEEMRVKAGGRLPAVQVAQICDQVLDVLAAAHAQGIVHRDIKPDNIFVLADGTVKVLDFGIAHIKEAAIQAEPTATGLLLGTPDFMSPEQAVGARGTIDAQTDIYAMGATMFTLLSSEAVCNEQALGALLAAISSRQARSLASAKVKDLPRELIAVVDKALALEKRGRWPSARAMQDALRKAVPEAAHRPSERPARAESKARLSAPPPRPSKLPAPPPRPSIRPPVPLPSRAPIARPSRTPPPIAVPPPPSGRMPSPASVPPPSHRHSDSGPPPSLAPNSGRTVVRPPPSMPGPRFGGSGGEPTRRGANVWTQEFTDGDMEGPTVATTDFVPQSVAPHTLAATTVARPDLSTEQLGPPAIMLSRPLATLAELDAQSTQAIPSHLLPPRAPHGSLPPPPPKPVVAVRPAQFVRIPAKTQPSKLKRPGALPQPSKLMLAEICLAALVVITLTIGGCLLLRH